MERPSVLFIVIDCMREDVFSSLGSKSGYFRSMIKNGYYFPNAMTAATNTIPSFGSILTGDYPFENGLESPMNTRLESSVKTLPEIFRSHGYSTMAFVTGPLVKETGISKGFDVYEYRGKFDYIHGRTKNRIISRVKSSKKPWFVMLHFWAAHHPLFTGSKKRLLKKKIEFSAVNLIRRAGILRILQKFYRNIKLPSGRKYSTEYIKSVKHIEMMAEEITKKLNPDVIVITGDHGERLDERLTKKDLQRRGPDGKPEQWLRHSYHIYDFLMNVPLLFYGKGFPKKTVRSNVRTIDIFPTLVDYMGFPKQKSSGDSLLPPDFKEESRETVSIAPLTRSDGETEARIDGIRDERYKFGFRSDSYGDEEFLFDLKNDSHENSNILTEKQEIAHGMKERLKKIKSEKEVKSSKLDRKEKKIVTERLKDLGYM
ncbi:MAG: sulfatase-like hydrolase/transferase [Candidatus Woesearchaeota archaeon]